MDRVNNRRSGTFCAADKSLGVGFIGGAEAIEGQETTRQRPEAHVYDAERIMMVQHMHCSIYI